MKLDTNPETFQLKYHTAKLWMEYMKMVNIVRAIMRSERTVEWSIHQWTPQEMLTCLASYCYLHRVPIRVHKIGDYVGRHVSQCSQAFDPRSACCQEEQLILGRVVRIPFYRTGTDEEPEDEWCLTRGRSMTEPQRLVWYLPVPACTKVNNVMQQLTSVIYQTSEQHKDVSHARQTWSTVIQKRWCHSLNGDLHLMQTPHFGT